MTVYINGVEQVAKFDIFDKFREFLPWVSLEGFNVGGDAGYTVAAEGSLLYLATAATTDSDAWADTAAVYYNLIDAGKLIIWEIIISTMAWPTLQNIWIRFAETIADPPLETNRHFGWKIIGSDLYASNANNVTQTITDTLVDIAAASQRTRLKIVLNPGTDCKYYVNDVLKATHDTNLPVAINYYFHIHIRTLTDQARNIEVGRYLLEKEHA